MSVESQRRQSNSYLERPSVGRLADVMEIILDKGLVIDAFARLSLVGTELVTIDSRMVIASVDTYLRFAEACIRLDLGPDGGKDLTDRAPNITPDGADDRIHLNGAPAGNGVHPKPQLNGHAHDVLKQPRDTKQHADLNGSTTPHDPILSMHKPDTVHVRPYDWKNSTAKDLLR